MTWLIRLLEHKFGPLDETAKGRLEAVDAEQLLLWGERVLTPDSLSAVFQDDNLSASEPPGIAGAK